ncbi:MAG: GGDEF domain-containing protein [Rhodocyclales bacterium GT-UBC]|nr:MAG: GGDEF domain-containing protein [Rhodocyclales bacterium GT-UBC]
MTTTSANRNGYINLEAFGLAGEELASLAALADIWRPSVEEVLAEEMADPLLAEFAELTISLVGDLADQQWQRRWLACWYKLYGRGFALPDLAVYFFRIVAQCEQRLFDPAVPASRAQLDLFSILRRSIFAAACCAIEMSEEARRTEHGVPGELAALHFLRTCAQSAVPVAVLSIALVSRNRFGHLAATDLQSLPGLLVERLDRPLRPADRIFAGREGEWLVILHDVQVQVRPSLVAAQILRVFEEPLRLLSGRSLPMVPSIGGAMMPADGADGESILQAARLARWASSENQHPLTWFQVNMRQDWQLRFEMGEEFRRALENEKLCLFLQPQIDVPSQQCTSAELLLRWQRDNGEWVPPLQIIELIEEHGWGRQFTDWLVRHAMRMASDLDAVGIGIPLAFNLTVDDLLDVDLPELIAQRLATWRLPGERFIIELTESAMMTDPQRCLAVMQRLRELGVSLALDDFGTGYSSLSYLVSLPLNEIKIDRSFIHAMASSEEHLRVVRTIIDLAWDLGMMPLAEGVEDAAQIERLHQLGCNHVQGFFYAKPMAMPDFVTWYAERRT